MKRRVGRALGAFAPIGPLGGGSRLDGLPPVLSVHTARGDLGVRYLQTDSDLVPVLLLHGVTWTGDLNFHAVIEPLWATRSVIVMDHRGHGSGLPGRGEYTMADLADDAVAVLDALEVTSVVVVGFSLGSLTAMHLALRHPERLRGMVLTAGSLTLRSSTAARRAVVGMTRTLDVATVVGIRLSVGARYFGVDRHRRWGEAVRADWPWIRSELARNDQRALGAALRAAIGHELRGEVSAIAKVPSVVVVLTRDLLVPAPLQWKMARRLGAPTVAVVADHEAPLTHPHEYRDAVFKALAYLDGSASTDADAPGSRDS